MRRVAMFLVLAVMAVLGSQVSDPADTDMAGPATPDSVASRAERDLPARERGYRQEYTVDTPGPDDRGPRRLVEGAGGDLYYTDDHYGSFRRVRGPS